MGTSTDALLFYGFEIPGGENEGTPFWLKKGEEDDGDWEEFVASKLGVPKPTVEYSEETKPLYHAYWETKREAVKKLGIEVVMHCHIDAPMYALAVKASAQRAYRGSPVTLGPNALIVDPTWDQQLRDFAQLVGVEMGQPTWILASYWG
ncbi:conserved hypothetical protein [Virus Rctr197k]|nr:conserved hypothetical protein [Virus Rctr197k]